MMVMTAKVNIKKLLLILGITVGVILAAILVLQNNAQPTAGAAVSGNDARVEFLKSFGWEVSASPTESGQVRIPETPNQVFDRYNQLQKSQGYDLQSFAGKTVMRYVYKVNNFPGATEPVYATVLVYKDRIIGGDITDTSPKGAVQSFKLPTGLDAAGQ